MKTTRILLILALLLGLALVLGTRFSAPYLAPEVSGAVDGQLRPCPDTPNCVCSCESDEHGIEPLAIGPNKWGALIQTVAGMPGATIVDEQDGYLRAEFRTRIMGYIDDVEFLQDGDKVHVRSASRLGRSDLGANRKRVETIRAQCASQGAEGEAVSGGQ